MTRIVLSIKLQDSLWMLSGNHIAPYTEISSTGVGDVLVDIGSFHPEMALFRNLGVNLQDRLCGVPTYASAQSLERNCPSPCEKFLISELETDARARDMKID